MATAIALGTTPETASAHKQIGQSQAMMSINWDQQSSPDEPNAGTSGPTPIPTPSTPDPSGTSTAAQQGGMVTHVVGTGETLRTLAARYQVTRESIRQANNLTSDTLWGGQQLLIPSASSAAAGAQPQSDSNASDSRTTTSDTAGDSQRTVSAVSSRGGTRGDSDVPHTAESVTSDPTASMPEPAHDSATHQDDFGSRVVQAALQVVGSRYRWAGISPATGFDCSGLVYYVYQQAGRPIPRTQWPQLAAGPRVSRDEMQPGDIIYFANTYVRGLSHNGIYIGDGKFVHAEGERYGVIVSSLSEGYWGARFYAANRP